MLNGQHPFGGSSQASIIAGILERETPSLGDAVPAAVDRIVGRCLAKNPDDRWQSARDLKAALRWIGEFATVAPVALPAPPAGRWRGWAAAAIVLAAAVVLAASLALIPWSRPAATEVTRFTVYPPAGAVFSRTSNATIAVPQFALSPNGRMLVFAANTGNKSTLWIRSLDQTQPRQLPGTEGGVRPFWSPDSLWIGFFGEGSMKKILATGNAVQSITENMVARGASWGRDDTILYSDGSAGLFSIPAGGGQSKVVTTLDASHAELTHRWPQLLPDGRGYLFTMRSDPATRGLYAYSMDGKTRKHLLLVDSSAVYAPPGYLLWIQGDTLLAQRFDTGKFELSGQPVTVAEGVGRSSTSEAAISASAGGNLAYAGPMLQEGRLTWFESSGIPSDSPVPEGDYVDFRLSPDGNRLVTSLIDPKTGTTDIWLTDLQRRSRPERFTNTQGVNAAAIWSPDGKQLMFRTNRSGLLELYQKSTAGGNDEARVTGRELRAAGIDTVSVVPSDWSPDGKYVIAESTGRGTGNDLWLIPLNGEAKPSKLSGSASASDEIHANFSPKGDLLAYSSNETGRFEVYVRSLTGPERRALVSTSGGYEPRWRADGRELYYLSEDRKLMAVTVADGLSFGVPKPLFQTRVPPGVDAFRTHYVPAADGKRFLINTQTSDLEPNPITVVLNWTAGLR
jgi:Tol biopolymer transport system component